MAALLTGWSGPAIAVPVSGCDSGPRATAAAPARTDEITCSVRRDHDGSIAVSASVADVVVRKTVSPDGHATVTVERDDDSLSIVSTRTTIAVSRGRDSVLVNVAGGHEEQLSRVQRLLLGSVAARGLRTLATVLDESGSQSPEKLALRFTGALVAQLEGEEGAVRRLSRELLASYGGSQRRGPVGGESRARATPVECWRRYQTGVLILANTLETSLSSFSFVNPMRLVCSFAFLMQVERLWFTYLSESSGVLW